MQWWLMVDIWFHWVSVKIVIMAKLNYKSDKFNSEFYTITMLPVIQWK